MTRSYTKNDIDKLLSEYLNNSDSDDEIDENELLADDDYILYYSNKNIRDTFNNILLYDNITIYDEMLKYNISLSNDAAVLLDKITINIYNNLILDRNTFYNKISLYSSNIKQLLCLNINPNNLLSYNVYLVIKCLVKIIMDLSISHTISSLKNIITYRDINLVISQNEDLYYIFKTDIIHPKFFENNIKYNIYYKYPILIPTEFNKFINKFKISLNDYQKSFIIIFLYYKYTENKQLLHIEDYINRLFRLFNTTMSFKDLTVLLMNNI